MLDLASTCVSRGGTDCKESQCLLDGIVDIGFTMSGCRDAIRTEELCFCPLTLGDNSSDSLDNSIIGSNLSTLTWRGTALVCGTHRASLGGLRSKAQGLHGISTVELWDCRLWISVDAPNMESGSPYAL